MEKKIQCSLGLSMMLFLAFTIVSGKIEPQRDNPDDPDEYKIFNIGKELVFQCKSSSGDATGLVWKKGENEIKSGDEKYETNPKDGKLIIKRAHEDDAGVYTCALDGEIYKFITNARVIVKIPSNSYVVENEKLEINCIVKGTDPKVTWKRARNITENPKDTDYENIVEGDERYKFEEFEKVPNARMVIKSATLADYTYYSCEGINEVMEIRKEDPAKSEGLVRVKDKLAALWPFLGICAEVFILCTIILIYEKRRNKTDLDESDTDQSPDQKK